MGVVSIRGNCCRCEKPVRFKVTSQEFNDWKGGTVIQKAMPNLSPDQREFLVSGVCGECFDEMFGSEDSGEDSEG